MQSTEIGILSSLYTRIHGRKLEVDESGCKGTADLSYCGRSVSVLFVSCSEAVRGGDYSHDWPMCSHHPLHSYKSSVAGGGWVTEWLRELAEYLFIFFCLVLQCDDNKHCTVDCFDNAVVVKCFSFFFFFHFVVMCLMCSKRYKAQAV